MDKSNGRKPVARSGMPFQDPHGHGEAQGKLLEQAIGRAAALRKDVLKLDADTDAASAADWRATLTRLPSLLRPHAGALTVAALLLLLSMAACAQTPPAPKQAADLEPLGPCPASSWKPEAPPPTASARTSMVLLAVAEWFRFGQQTMIFSREGKPRTEIAGVKERDAAQRINDYWKSVDRPTLSGLDDAPWSAAFI